jgi:hypothetical protein
MASPLSLNRLLCIHLETAVILSQLGIHLTLKILQPPTPAITPGGNHKFSHGNESHRGKALAAKLTAASAGHGANVGANHAISLGVFTATAPASPNFITRKPVSLVVHCQTVSTC